MDQKVADISVERDYSVPPFLLATLLTLVLPFSGASWPLVMDAILSLFLVGCVLIPPDKVAGKKE